MSSQADIDRKERKRNDRARLQAGFIVTGAWQTCINCLEWDSKEEVCKLYRQRPPLDVITVGCKSWDDIPF